jgi:hypothetical protein
LSHTRLKTILLCKYTLKTDRTAVECKSISESNKTASGNEKVFLFATNTKIWIKIENSTSLWISREILKFVWHTILIISLVIEQYIKNIKKWRQMLLVNNILMWTLCFQTFYFYFIWLFHLKGKNYTVRHRTIPSVSSIENMKYGEVIEKDTFIMKMWKLQIDKHEKLQRFGLKNKKKDRIDCIEAQLWPSQSAHTAHRPCEHHPPLYPWTMQHVLTAPPVLHGVLQTLT